MGSFKFEVVEHNDRDTILDCSIDALLGSSVGEYQIEISEDNHSKKFYAPRHWFNNIDEFYKMVPHTVQFLKFLSSNVLNAMAVFGGLTDAITELGGVQKVLGYTLRPEDIEEQQFTGECNIFRKLFHFTIASLIQDLGVCEFMRDTYLGLETLDSDNLPGSLALEECYSDSGVYEDDLDNYFVVEGTNSETCIVRLPATYAEVVSDDKALKPPMAVPLYVAKIYLNEETDLFDEVFELDSVEDLAEALAEVRDSLIRVSSWLDEITDRAGKKPLFKESTDAFTKMTSKVYKKLKKFSANRPDTSTSGEEPTAPAEEPTAPGEEPTAPAEEPTAPGEGTDSAEGVDTKEPVIHKAPDPMVYYDDIIDFFDSVGDDDDTDGEETESCDEYEESSCDEEEYSELLDDYNELAGKYTELATKYNNVVDILNGIVSGKFKPNLGSDGGEPIKIDFGVDEDGETDSN